jgi:hypothetical protein
MPRIPLSATRECRIVRRGLPSWARIPVDLHAVEDGADRAVQLDPVGLGGVHGEPGDAYVSRSQEVQPGVGPADRAVADRGGPGVERRARDGDAAGPSAPEPQRVEGDVVEHEGPRVGPHVRATILGSGVAPT